MTNDKQPDVRELFDAWWGCGEGDVSDKLHSLIAWKAAWQSALSQPAAVEGWKLVPVEPTEEMIDKAEDLDWSDDDVRGNCYRQWHVMVATAPARLQAQNIAIGDGRAEFEAYAYQMGSRDFELNEFGGYKNSHTADKWWFWKSSRDELNIRQAATSPLLDKNDQTEGEVIAWRDSVTGTLFPTRESVEKYATRLDALQPLYLSTVDDKVLDFLETAIECGELKYAERAIELIRSRASIASHVPPQPDSNELVELRRDAERYRWLQTESNRDYVDFNDIWYESADDLDAAIDEALAQSPSVGLNTKKGG